MSALGPGDLLIARMLARRPWARMLQALFWLVAFAGLYSRVWLGRTDPVLPWYVAFAGIYGFIMAALSRDARARLVWALFGILVVSVFAGPALGWDPRVVGALEAAACLVILWGLRAMARAPVLESVTIDTNAGPGPQETPR